MTCSIPSMSSRLHLFLVIVLFSTLLSTYSLAGTVYQYVDEDGAVCISDRPPEKGKKKTTVKEMNYRDKTSQEKAYNDAQEASRIRQWEAREDAR